MSAPFLLGREREVHTLEGLLDGTAAGGRVLVVRGHAGIGKSTLLQHAADWAAERGMQVLAATGIVTEADLPFAGLHQLLRPILDRADALPAAQRDAVQAAFGMTGATDAEPFLIALGVLSLLTDAAAQRPVVMIVDDAHWLDRASAHALTFVGRRIGSDPIGVLVGLRDGHDSVLLDAGFAELAVAGLPTQPARALLELHGDDLPADTRERILAEADGNPLALIELPAALRSIGLQTQASLLPHLPLTATLERAFMTRARRLPQATQTLLLVAAMDQGSAIDDVLAVATRVWDVPLARGDLLPAIEAGLIELEGDRVRFRHPLVRSALEQAASATERGAVHAAFADVLAGDRERRVWHRAAAVAGIDDEVARELEDAGHRAMRRGAIPTASAAWERAAALVDDDSERGRLLLQAAHAASEIGRRETVLRLVRRAEGLALDTRERAQWMWLDDGLEHRSYADLDWVHELVRVAREVAGADRMLALQLLTAAAGRCYFGGHDDDGRAVVAVAEALSDGDGEELLLLIRALGDPVAKGPLVRAAAAQADVPQDTDGLWLRATALSIAGGFDRVGPLLAAAARRLRQEGRLRLLAQAQGMRAFAGIATADFADAVPANEEVRRLAAETFQTVWKVSADTAEAMVAALRGDRATVEALTVEAEGWALRARSASVLSLVQYARGMLELGEARYAEAYEQLRRVGEPGDAARHQLSLYHASGDLAEAAVRSGHRAEAHGAIARCPPWSGGTPTCWGDAMMLFAQVVLAEDEAADATFAAALATDLASWPFVQARVQLAYGEWLRRQRRMADSRAPLREARDAFEALGIHPWAQRARRELRASGETSRRRASDSLDDLTPQELQIAQLVAQGLSNRAIGDRLYLSHRTVESHLYRVFPKLGVTSRSQLAAALGPRLGTPA